MRRDLRSLARNQLFAAPVRTLNDPFEAQFEFHGNTLRVGRLLNLLAARAYSEAARAAEDNLLTEIAKFFRIADEVGVYSLGQTATDELMWAYYANSHRGFCVEYDLELLRKYKLGNEGVIDVAYEQSMPAITARDLFALEAGKDNLLRKFLGTKSKRWAHEQEIRIVTGKSGLIEYDFRAVKGIYFGHRCNPRFLQLTMRVLAGRGISYYLVEPVRNSYMLGVQPIDDQYSNKRAYRARIAPVNDGVPYFDELLEPHRDLVMRAIEIARRDPYCERVLDAYVSGSKGTKDNPVFYVTYSRSDGVPNNMFLSKSEIVAHQCN